MRGFGSSLEQISNKLLSAEAAVEVVKPGHRVFVGTASASPFTLVEALERRKPTPADVELFYFLTTGLAPLWVEQQSAYHHRCFFVGSEARALVHTGRAEYVPISLTQIPYLMANGRIRADVAFVQVSPPDTHGFVSLGISVAITMSVLRYAKTIVAEVNPFMPRTLRDRLSVWQIRAGASAGPYRDCASGLSRKSPRRRQAAIARAYRPQARRRPRLSRRGGTCCS